LQGRDNNRYASDGLKIQNGSVTQIQSDGVITKNNYVNQESWLKAVNYFYTKNYVASFNVYPSLSENSYNTLFSQALRDVNERIGGPAIADGVNSFSSNTAKAPRVFVEREIYTKSYKANEAFELNQAILSGVYTPGDADLAAEEVEKLYCVQTYEPYEANSFTISKQNYYYPAQDYNEEVSFRRFLENSAASLSYQTGENFGAVSFKDQDIEVEKLFRIEYVTGNSFSYDDTSNFRAWSATAAPPSNITISNQDTKSYSYHLYGYNSSSAPLSFIKSNVQNGESATSASFSNLVVLKFIKQGLTNSVFQQEENEGDAKITKSYINTTIANNSGSLLDPSKVRINIQTYNYKVVANLENHQWTLFNQNPINNNIYGSRDSSNFSEPRFFQDDKEETKELLSTLFFFPNGSYTSKNYEGKPITTSSINALSDGLFENHIYIKEENETSKKYESNYVLETLENGYITKLRPSTEVLDGKGRFRNTRRLQITKVKYNFYTKDLVLIGDAGSPYSINFNYGWEYDLQYKLKTAPAGSSGSSGSSGPGASTGWTTMSKDVGFSKDIISAEYSAISPYYFSAEDLETPNYLSMVAFKTNLPLFLDDANYEFRIFKQEKLVVSSDSANVIKKTNFLPIKVDWNEVAGCGYYNIYQKDRNNKLTFLRSEPSGINSFSYVIPDVSQRNVDLGVYNFGANGNNYYDIVVSGIKSSVVKKKETLASEYGFEVGDSNSQQNTVTKFENVASYTPVSVSSPTYSQLLDFNNPESKTSGFKINQDYNEYYFVTDKADASLENIPSSFESYVLNTGNASCFVGGSSVNTNQYAKISNNGVITVANAASLPSSSFDLLDAEQDDDILYLSANVTVLNSSSIASKTLTLVNDSNSSINVTFGSTVSISANQTKKLLFSDDGVTKSIQTQSTYSNVTMQDSKIYHPKEGFINFNHTTGEFSSADSFANLPIYNFSKDSLVINGLSLDADSFNYVSWNGSSASKSQKTYFDGIKIYLKAKETEEDSTKLLKDDTDIILSQFSTAVGTTRDYFFLKDESINRALNIRIINGSSIEVLQRQYQDFKLTVTQKSASLVTYSIIYPSSSPFFELSNSREQLVLLKGDLVQYIDLKSLDAGLPKESFVYFVNKNSQSVFFYRNTQENIVYTLAENQIARAMLVTVGSTQVVRLDILNETLSHFYFDIDNSLISSSINILDLNFCGTQINLPPASSLQNKELFLICRNRFLPNKINKESVKDTENIISTEDNPSTLEINEIGDLAQNSICLRVTGSSSDALPILQRTSFLSRNVNGTVIDLEDNVIDRYHEDYFYIRNSQIDTFTIKDSYNRKYGYKGKIFLPTLEQSVGIQSFDSADGNNLYRIKEVNSIDFDYAPDEYVNGRLQASKPLIPDARIFSYESESGSTAKSFPNALATDQILINFAYDTVTVSVDSVTKTLKKNRLVKNSGANYVYPIYNNKEFFIAQVNSERTNTRKSGGTTFYYIIEADKADVDSIILPDISATISFVIKNVSGRPYEIKTLSGVLVHTLLPSSGNNQKLFTYTGAPYTVTTDTTDFSDSNIFGEVENVSYLPTSIALSNQAFDLEAEHPLASLWAAGFSKIDLIQDAFIDIDGDAIKLDIDYSVFDVYSSVSVSTSKIIYCYGRKAIDITQLGDKKYIVNDFYLFASYDGTKIKKEQFYLTDRVSDEFNAGAYNLKVIDTNHTDLTKFFKSQNAINGLPNVILIPITKYSSKFYLPNLDISIGGSTLASLLSGKKILFVNLVKSDSSAPNSIYNYSTAVTSNLLDVNSIALYSVSGSAWVKETSSLPQVKKVFATARNLKGISGLSTTEIVGGNEFLYLPNFNRFNVDINSFIDKSFRDFYVFNPCKYRMYIGSNNSLLGNGALTRVIRNATQNLFTASSLDLNASSVFSVTTLNYAEGRAPENLTQTVNELYPNLKFGARIKVIQNIGNSKYTYLFRYNSKNKAEEIIIKNREFGVLDLKDLTSYDANSKLFIYGSSQVNSSGNFFDSYSLKLLNAGLLGSEKFYIYNNTPYYLSIFFDFATETFCSIPPKSFIEISDSRVSFLGSYEKGIYYISKKDSSTNYLLKTDLKFFLNGIYDYVSFAGEKESDKDNKNIIITPLIKDETYASSYYYADQAIIETVVNNFRGIYITNLASMNLTNNTQSYNLLKPVYRITTAGHYLLTDNNNDLTVTAPSYGQQIFLINNCPRDIFVNILSDENRRRKVYRNSVMIVEAGPTSGVVSRYLKKAKARDEFYCIFNPNTAISTQREITLNLGIIRNEELLPILDDNQVEQKSYVKLLSKDGTSTTINLALRNYYNVIL